MKWTPIYSPSGMSETYGIHPENKGFQISEKVLLPKKQEQEPPQALLF